MEKVAAKNGTRFDRAMSNLITGLIRGAAFGALSVGMMLPMSFPDKKAALLAAFHRSICYRSCDRLRRAAGVAGWVIGLLFGALLSLPAAIITKAFAPVFI